MVLICESCGRYEEYTQGYEEIPDVCNCGGSLTEAEQCEICENYYCDLDCDDGKCGVCNECLDDYINNDTERIVKNNLDKAEIPYLSTIMFSSEELNEILWKALVEKHGIEKIKKTLNEDRDIVAETILEMEGIEK